MANTFCCLCFLTAYMQVKCDLSMPIALEGPLAGYHEYCMPSKSKGLLPASCKSLPCPHSPVYLFCLVIARLLSPVVSPIDHFGVFRHYATTPHSELEEALSSIYLLTPAHAFFAPFPELITMLDGEAYGEGMDNKPDGDLTRSSDQELEVWKTLRLVVVGRQRVGNPQVRQVVTVMGPSGQRIMRFQ